MSLDVAVRKSFGRAFRLDVAFQTGEGRLALLGASGSGKSLTLRCIAGITRPDSGRIVLNGRVLFDSAAGVNLPPQARRVGYLFQDYALFPNMTVAENVAAGVGSGVAAAKAAGAGRGGAAAAVVADFLAAFRLEGLAGRKPAELSGGQRQRVALARMLAARPEAVLLDEPFSALDSHLREHMQNQLASALRETPDAVMVTHSRDEAYRLCPRLLALDGGRVLADGPTQEIFARPRFLAVALLTGCKNISRAERLDSRRLRALDWGLDLTSSQEVEMATTHVGVRAHDFRPIFPGENNVENGMENRRENEDVNGGEYAGGHATANVFPVRVLGRTEDPFEANIHFLPAGAGPETEPLWWKVAKPVSAAAPTHMLVPAGAVLPLATSPAD